ncbi:MAG: recombinase family protein [Devosia sp.]
MNDRKILRCAIYTRKSSEEGLDQDFNSLEAQREACEAYVRSQAHEGWKIVPEPLDDGGFSGGNTDRPALKRLMQLVSAGEIDVIVIYKIDRLTRSLTDFARMAETFDKHNVSFVSVTQQFNTTTSMGRLMLNVLLSFAQFEREITGERIRDKIAASKRKGMWMGGNPPMGYDVHNRQLVVNEVDAATVRGVFALYLESGTVPALLARLQTEGVVTARRFSAKGRHHGERPFTRGHLYKLLTNPIYIGRVPHKASSHPGQHPALIDKALWDDVQAQLAANVQGTRTRRRRATERPSLLAGILVTASGNGFTDSHANKGSRRYRYYVEEQQDGARPAIRLPVPDIDNAVAATVVGFLRDRGTLLSNLPDLERVDMKPVAEQAETIASSIGESRSSNRMAQLRPLLHRVVYREDALTVEVSDDPLRSMLGVRNVIGHGRATNNRPEDASPIVLNVPVIARRRGRQLKLVLGNNIQPPTHDEPLLTVVARAHNWAQSLVRGEIRSITEIAKRERVSPTYVGQLLPLGFLAPPIVEAILDGGQPVTLTADRIVRREGIAASWVNQVRTIGERDAGTYIRAR